MQGLAHSTLLTLAGLLWVSLCGTLLSDDESSEDRHGVAFFEKRIRPVLTEHCYKCHSAEAKELMVSARSEVEQTGKKVREKLDLRLADTIGDALETALGA